MESSAARVASMMLRCNSRKNMGTLFSQWTARSGPRDPMRRMTMGGAAPPPEVAAPPTDAGADAFCAVQLTPSNSITRQDSLSFLLPSMGSLTAAASGLLLSPAASIKEGISPLSPSTSINKASLESLLASLSMGASRGPEENSLQSCKSVTMTAQPSPLGGPLVA